MEKWKQIKVKHHYVWEHYLKNWAVNNKVFWLTSTGKIACDSPKGLCREDGFYKISIFDDADLRYIRMWSEKSPEFLQKQHAKDIDPFIKISNMIRLVRASGIVNEEICRSERTLLYNSLENLYCGVESSAKIALDGLAKGNISVMDDNNVSIGLYMYLGHQITRTKSIKEKFFEQYLSRIPPSRSGNEARRLAEKNWWFISYMFGGNIGYSLYTSRYEDKLFLVKNISDIPFITSDSPVINVHPENDAKIKGEVPENLDLMFPISPEYMLFITSSSKWGSLSSGANEKAVIDLNERIATKAYYSIYGNCRSVIQSNKGKVAIS